MVFCLSNVLTFLKHFKKPVRLKKQNNFILRPDLFIRMRSPHIPLHGRQLPLYHELMDQNPTKFISSEHLAKPEPIGKLGDKENI